MSFHRHQWRHCLQKRCLSWTPNFLILIHRSLFSEGKWSYRICPIIGIPIGYTFLWWTSYLSMCRINFMQRKPGQQGSWMSAPNSWKSIQTIPFSASLHRWVVRPWTWYHSWDRNVQRSKHRPKRRGQMRYQSINGSMERISKTRFQSTGFAGFSLIVFNIRLTINAPTAKSTIEINT